MNNRLITDNVRVAFEKMHHISQKKKNGKVGQMALKLDMSKAYNKVEWGCLKKNYVEDGFSYALGGNYDEMCSLYYICCKN